jgi:hypothetical protein
MAKPVFLLALLLSACSRQPATDEEARHAVTQCGLVVQSSMMESGFDRVMMLIFVRKVPKAEFDRKLDCVRWVFFLKRLEADISNGSDGPAHDVAVGYESDA